jgi:CDP-glycerol glycerophosphotransferase
MTVSIIVPVHDRTWLKDCLQSIESQDYKDMELIIIDDPEKSGPAAARNRGLEKASGEFIAFVDADDYLQPNAVHRLMDAIYGVDMVVGSFRKFGNFEMLVRHPTSVLEIKEVADYVMKNLKDPRHYQMLSGCWAKLYRRDRLGRFPALTTAEDMALNFDYLRLCKRVRFISDVVYNNRKHDGSVTTIFDENNKRGLFEFLEGLKYVKNFLSQLYPADELEDALDSSKVYHSMLYFMRACAHTREPMKEVFKGLYP